MNTQPKEVPKKDELEDPDLINDQDPAKQARCDTFYFSENIPRCY